jgi:hypothetical protein
VGVTNNTVPVIVVLRLVGETIVKELVLINALLPNAETIKHNVVMFGKHPNRLDDISDPQ